MQTAINDKCDNADVLGVIESIDEVCIRAGFISRNFAGVPFNGWCSTPNYWFCYYGKDEVHALFVFRYCMNAEIECTNMSIDEHIIFDLSNPKCFKKIESFLNAKRPH